MCLSYQLFLHKTINVYLRQLLIEYKPEKQICQITEQLSDASLYTENPKMFDELSKKLIELQQRLWLLRTIQDKLQ